MPCLLRAAHREGQFSSHHLDPENGACKREDGSGKNPCPEGLTVGKRVYTPNRREGGNTTPG